MVLTWIFQKLIEPFLPYLLVAALALGAIGTLGGLYYGHKWASQACAVAVADAEKKAAQAVVARYQNLMVASEKQHAEEMLAAEQARAAIAERAAQLELENAKAAANQQDMEADLAAAIQDKGKLDAIITKLRASARTDCRASDDDVRLDGRLRGPR